MRARPPSKLPYTLDLFGILVLLDTRNHKAFFKVVSGAAGAGVNLESSRIQLHWQEINHKLLFQCATTGNTHII